MGMARGFCNFVGMLLFGALCKTTHLALKAFKLAVVVVRLHPFFSLLPVFGFFP